MSERLDIPIEEQWTHILRRTQMIWHGNASSTSRRMR